MKVLHWNIHGWTDSNGLDNVSRVTDLIADVDPDVISLVEVDEDWSSPSRLEQVADATGYHWAFIPAFEYREQGGFGNAILSKSPFLNVHQRQLLPPSLYDGSEPSEPRAVLFVQIESELGSVRVASTHLPRSDAGLRQRALNRTLEWVGGSSDPLVVSGDFNQPAASWVDANISVVPDPAIPTYPTLNPDEAIDYMLLRGVAAISYDAIASDASDHLPIAVELCLPEYSHM